MYKISEHPIIPVQQEDNVEFIFENHTITAQRGCTIATALHRAGYIVHNHSLNGRNRTMQCGIGKCGACEMLVDGKVTRICITKVDGVKCVERIKEGNDIFNEGTKTDAPAAKTAAVNVQAQLKEQKCSNYKTTVAIIGAGPSGLAVREELNKAGIDNLVIDNNSVVGGQFNMQTHQFFFFEKEKTFGGLRGFDIAQKLAGENSNGILLDSVVWDILEDKRLAVKNIVTNEVYYIFADIVVVATGAVPFMPPFKNDDVPGVYTAAVVQKMMNRELTLLGKNILTIGAGNIGYLTSYQAMQAGANIRAIIEAAPREGGFPVQANRIKRLGIPIITSHILLEAIPNEDRTGITGAIIAECENFIPIEGTEQVITDIDCINICTGLTPDNQLFTKGKEVFGRSCYSVGDAERIGEGTSAVLRGKQCAYQIFDELGVKYNYDEYLKISKEYIDSRQHPVKILDKPYEPTAERAAAKPFVVANCLYGFACNPCTFSCKQKAITKNSTSSVPVIDYDKCIGCMECVYQCPGLAIFGYNTASNHLFLPVEYKVNEGENVVLVNDNGEKIGEGVIEKILVKANKTNIARVKALNLNGTLTDVKGLLREESYPHKLSIAKISESGLEVTDNSSKSGRKCECGIKADDTYICHCEDVTESSLIAMLGNRKSITANELKHITRIGMGACRGKRCLDRARTVLRKHGIELQGTFTPRAPMANLVNLGEISEAAPTSGKFVIQDMTHSERVEADVLIAGGGIAGSALLRYFSESGYKPVLINNEAGSSWRNIAGGRPAFSLPALAELGDRNRQIFENLSRRTDIDFHYTNYVNFAHDEKTYEQLEASRAWSNAYMVDKKYFTQEISPYFNKNLNTYSHALITKGCWQASPGKTINAIRQIGIDNGGVVLEGAELIEVAKTGNRYEALVKYNDRYYLYKTDIFINALGSNAAKFAKQLGIDTGLYPVKHQAFITKRLPLIGRSGRSLDMLIDRRKYKGFSAVYGQQLRETGQIIGCASPAVDAGEAYKNLKYGTAEFLEIVSEVFSDWIPALKDIGFQATWSGYYTEPRYIVDPAAGLFVGMRGHGFMLSQYIARLYVDAVQGKNVPDYFREMSLQGNGLSEEAFK